RTHGGWPNRRRPDPRDVQFAGGQICPGIVDTAPDISSRSPVVLRLSQLERILGISIPGETVHKILQDLGCRAEKSDDAAQQTRWTPPSWRHDLTREADLIEEVARIYGYEKIPEDHPVPVTPSTRRPFDIALDTVRMTMVAAGFSEAMTPSVVTKDVDGLFSPWTENAAIQTRVPMLKGARRVRRSLVPALVASRAQNWSASRINADLFEVAHAYLPIDDSPLPRETYMLGIASGRPYPVLKGTLDALLQRLGIQDVAYEPQAIQGLQPGSCVRVRVGDAQLGYIGLLTADSVKKGLKAKMPGNTVVAEISLPALLQLAQLVPQQCIVSQQPTIVRDLNLIVDESLFWSDLESTIRSGEAQSGDIAGGNDEQDVRLVRAVDYQETYRDAEKDGAGKKRVLMSVALQHPSRTLTGEEADAAIDAILRQCAANHGAILVA
ncbi:MAG: phenylalanine--tRNA ligase subunit beta, partial [Planctomycetota bacterium]